MLPPDSTMARFRAATKKAALEAASEAIAAARPQLDARRLLEALLERERLGSTGLGTGVAIPHCRMKDCGAPAASLLRLREPVDFGAPDDEPVDLLFTLVVPDGERQRHLQLLANLAAVFEQAANRASLRRAEDDAELRRTWLAIAEPRT